MRFIIFVKAISTCAIATIAALAICGQTQADVVPNPPQKVVVSNDSQSASPSRPMIGFDIGEYLPTDSVVKNRFGAEWFTVGLGEGQIPTDETKGQLRFELDLLANTKGDNRAILIPLGIEYELGLGTGAVAPYVGLGGEVIPSVVQSSTDNVKSQLRGTFGGSVYAGLNFNRAANIEVRYRAMEKIAGYDFNGGEATLGLRF